MKIIAMENEIDFICKDYENGATIIIQTIEENGEFRTMYTFQNTAFTIPTYSDALVFGMRWKNRVEAIIGTLTALMVDFGSRSPIYYRDAFLLCDYAIEEMKYYRFEQLNLFEDVSAKRTYRISREVSQTSRRKNQSDVSIYD